MIWKLVWAIVIVSVFMSACEPKDGFELSKSEEALAGVPLDGFPNYQERLMLTAINRARSDPNNVLLSTAGECSDDRSAQKPMMHSHKAARAARFHSACLQKNGGGLSHDAYCTLKPDIAETNCDGALECACEPGSQHFNCEEMGGQGTSPWRRCAYFGFGATGEVGAAGYADGWQTVIGWMTECAPHDGHRKMLSSKNMGRIGLGYHGGSGGCFDTFYFGELTSGGAIYCLPAGVHYPETGTEIDFYLNYYHLEGAPQSVELVLDGDCHSMQREIGTPGNAIYKLSLTIEPGCHEYWFLVFDAAGLRYVYPETGSWGVGDCSGYNLSLTSASCETCQADQQRPCGPDRGACQAGTQDCVDGLWAACQGGIGPAQEICEDSIDNNCDGNTDEDCPGQYSDFGCLCGPEHGARPLNVAFVVGLLLIAIRKGRRSKPGRH
ncbi:MAG: hypothetical protein JRJ87_09800 [Deltaproteobacteria bacterium]|nr:hypothetical protein [Deltaproteobacteria bacterium]